jgi:hypothetical protein
VLTHEPALRLRLAGQHFAEPPHDRLGVEGPVGVLLQQGQ